MSRKVPPKGMFMLPSVLASTAVPTHSSPTYALCRVIPFTSSASAIVMPSTSGSTCMIALCCLATLAASIGAMVSIYTPAKAAAATNAMSVSDSNIFLNELCNFAIVLSSLCFFLLAKTLWTNEVQQWYTCIHD